MARTGGEVLVEALKAQGVNTAFGVPGESYLAVLDALHDSDIRFVLCRQEGGAAFMAEAWGKLTGHPGICFVTRGPGATNASIGVHTAMQDSTPMILFVGQIARAMRGREAFQELDYRAVFGTMAKWAVEIDAADRIPEIVARAFHVALSGRPGPVVIALPEDMLVETTEALVYAKPIAPAEPGVPEGAAERVARLIAGAERPLVMLGGGGWDGAGRAGRAALAALTAWAGKSGLPILTTFRCNDLIDNHDPAYAGDCGVGMTPHSKDLIRRADLILALNIRFGENTTDGYTLFDIPTPQQRLVHVHPSDDELGKILQTEDAIHAGAAVFARALAAQPAAGSGARAEWMAAARAGYEQNFDLPPQPGTLDMGAVMAHLREVLPEDAVVTNGAGNFAIWPGRLYRYGPKQRWLGPQSGAMGAGVPAAVAAKILDPGRCVLCFAGDGDFQMTGQELGTALQANARPIVLVLNNGSYGTIRMHQEREYPGRVSGTEIVNPDFVRLAEAYGMHGERVERTEDFAEAFARARASETGAVLELVVSTEAITPKATLSQIRAAATKS